MFMSKTKHFIYYYSTVSHELKWTIQHTNQIPRPIISVTGAFHNVGQRGKDPWLTGPYTNREWCHIERAGRGGNCMVAKQSLLLCLLSGKAYQCWHWHFALPLIGAKKLEKNRGAKFFDLNSAIFWGNEFLSCAHPRSSKKNDFFLFFKIFKNWKRQSIPLVKTINLSYWWARLDKK